jgi:hypothetical protein
MVAGSLIHFAFVAQVVVQQDGEARCKKVAAEGWLLSSVTIVRPMPASVQ